LALCIVGYGHTAGSTAKLRQAVLVLGSTTAPGRPPGGVREKKKDKGNVLFPSPFLSTPHSTQGDYPTLGVRPHQKKLTYSPVQEEDKTLPTSTSTSPPKERKKKRKKEKYR
jgi:hypothetical protein